MRVEPKENAARVLAHQGGERTEKARTRQSLYTHASTNAHDGQGVRREFFEAVKERVPVTEAARFYGYEPNRAHFVRCPFHGEKTASMRLWPDHWFCFGCGEGGTVIDFTAKLFGLTPRESVRKLDCDFHLCLPLDRPASAQERRKAAREQEHRHYVSDAEKRFEAWRGATLRRLSICLKIADDAAEMDPDELDDNEVVALRLAPALEYWFDVLNDERETADRVERQMEIFRNREEVKRLCQQVLSLTLRKFNQP